MIPLDPLERQISQGLDDLAGTNLPTYLDDILRRSDRMRQRPAWASPGRWIPMTVRTIPSSTAPPLRMAWAVLLIALLAVVLAAGAAIVGSQLTNDNKVPNALPAAAMPPTTCPPGTVLHSGDIATIAGTGDWGYSGDDGPAISAALVSSEGGSITADPAGAVYFSQDDQAIRRIGVDGVISTIAGGSSTPPMRQPTGVGSDAAGDIYIADQGWIWKRDPQGNVTPVAGTGVSGVSGDEGPALKAQINAYGVTVGPKGDLYIDDYLDTGIRRTIDTAGIIHRFSGTGGYGDLGDGGPATAAAFGLGNYAIAADQVGNVYLSDNDHYRIRMVDPSGTVRTVVGTGVPGYSGDSGPAADAQISDPRSMVVDPAGDLIFVDRDAGVVRKVDTAGTISTIAGTGKHGFSGDCGPALDATFNGPSLVAIHAGILYVVDYRNTRIRMIVP
jgi:hypothetical protein